MSRLWKVTALCCLLFLTYRSCFAKFLCQNNLISRMMFVLDASDTTSKENYIKEVVLADGIGKNFAFARNISLGVITNGPDTGNCPLVTDPPIKRPEVKDDNNQTIRVPVYDLLYLLSDYFSKPANRLKDDYILLFTDRKLDYPEKTQAFAKILQDLGVNIICVGTGQANATELLTVTGNMSRVIMAKSYDQPLLGQEIVNVICPGSFVSGNGCAKTSPTQPDIRGSPCHFMQGNTRMHVRPRTYFNARTCTIDGDYRRLCNGPNSCTGPDEISSDPSGSRCHFRVVDTILPVSKGTYFDRGACQQVNDVNNVCPTGPPAVSCGEDFKADIIYAIGTSKSLEWKNYITEITSFEKISNNFILGPNHVQITMKIFSELLVLCFSYNQSYDKTSMFKDIFGPAYKHVYRTDRTTEQLKELSLLAKGRLDAKKIVVLMTNENLYPVIEARTIQVFKTLQEQGINVITVGTGGANRTTLEALSGDQANVIMGSSFLDPSLQKQVLERICADPRC